MESPRITPNNQALYADEIDLISILAFFLRNLKSIIIITTIFGIIGLTVALLLPRQYTYTTAIEIGKIAQESTSNQIDFVQIKPADEVVETLNIAIIPSIVHDHIDTSSSNKIIDIKASVDKKANIITLTSKATLKEGETHQKLHENIANSLLSSHEQHIKPIQLTRQTDVRQSELSLEMIKDERLIEMKIDQLKQTEQNYQKELQQLLQSQEQVKRKITYVLPKKKQWLEDHKKLLEEKLAETSASINNRQEQQINAAKSASSSPDAMSMMLLDQQLLTLTSQQLNLEEELTIGIQRERVTLEQEEIELNNELKNLKKAEAILRNTIRLAQEEITKFKIETAHDITLKEQSLLKSKAISEYIIPTRVIRHASPSLRPSGPGKTIILALSIIVGGFIAIFIVLLREMLTSAKAQMPRR